MALGRFEASDGTAAITATPTAGHCVVTIVPGKGGGATGRPVIFDVASAHDGCTIKPATDVAVAAPLALGPTDPDPPDDEASDTGPAARGSIGWWYRHLRRPLLALAVLLPVPALVVIAPRRRVRGGR